MVGLLEPVVDGAGPGVDLDARGGEGEDLDPGFVAGGEVGVRGRGGDGGTGGDGVVDLDVEFPAGDCGLEAECC